MNLNQLPISFLRLLSSSLLLPSATMEPFQAKIVAAGIGSTLTALSSPWYYFLLRIFLFTVL